MTTTHEPDRRSAEGELVNIGTLVSWGDDYHLHQGVVTAIINQPCYRELVVEVLRSPHDECRLIIREEVGHFGEDSPYLLYPTIGGKCDDCGNFSHTTRRKIAHYRSASLLGAPSRIVLADTCQECDPVCEMCENDELASSAVRFRNGVGFCCDHCFYKWQQEQDEPADS